MTEPVSGDKKKRNEVAHAMVDAARSAPLSRCSYRIARAVDVSSLSPSGERTRVLKRREQLVLCRGVCYTLLGSEKVERAVGVGSFRGRGA